MKRGFALVLCTLMLISGFVACGSKVVSDVEPNPFVGTWAGTDGWFDETWVFEDNGEGSYDDGFLPYDFEYTYLEGKLSIYQKFFGSVSDEPSFIHEVTIDGGTVTLYDADNDTTRTLTMN